MNPIEALREIVGTDQVLTETVDILPYGFDGTAMLKQWPIAVVFPENTEEVAAIVRLANSEGIPVVSRGSGTGLSGGSIPVAGSIVLCLLRMNRILELDEKNLTIFVESGVVTQKVLDAADEVGLFYPPDPGSLKVSSIGGNVAENSGGLRGLKYGVTRNYVMGMEVVTADGTVHWLGNKCVKDVAGYNLKDLFIGSEGTLGVITKVLLRLLPKPAHRRTLVATYATMDAAADTVSAVIANKIIPCTMEFLDSKTIRCVEAFAKIGLPMDAEALLLIESDGNASVVEEEISQIERIAHDRGAILVRSTSDPEEALKLSTARRSAFSALARIRPTTILEDATVPRSELTKMICFIQYTAARHKLEVATFGHFGDGNLHPTFLTDERDKEEIERVEVAMKEIFDFALQLGGTITGEHGVGLAKKGYLKHQLGEGTYALLQVLKRAMDPQGILNPGKIVDLKPSPKETSGLEAEAS
jgi:glycolate oxidase